MASNTTYAGQVVRDAVRRFGHLPTQTLAKHLLVRHSDLFDGDLEKIRTRIRYYRGKQGRQSRDQAADKELFTKTVPMPRTRRIKRKPYILKPGLWLTLADLHVPFHEIAPIESAISAGQAEKVDGILLNGDVMDCAAVSYWPTAVRDFDVEVEAVVDFFDWLQQAFPGVPIIYKPGNHEYRLPNYFITHAPELATSLMSAIDNVLGLENKGIAFLDDKQIVKAGLLPILHGHEVGNLIRTVNPARGLFLRAKSWALCAHCHTTSQHTSVNIGGEVLTTWSMGCLCDLSPDFAPYANDWNWGFALINIEDDGNFEVINRRILPNGKVV